MGRIQQRPERLLATCLLVLALASFSASVEPPPPSPHPPPPAKESPPPPAKKESPPPPAKKESPPPPAKKESPPPPAKKASPPPPKAAPAPDPNTYPGVNVQLLLGPLNATVLGTGRNPSRAQLLWNMTTLLMDLAGPENVWSNTRSGVIINSADNVAAAANGQALPTRCIFAPPYKGGTPTCSTIIPGPFYAINATVLAANRSDASISTLSQRLRSYMLNLPSANNVQLVTDARTTSVGLLSGVPAQACPAGSCSVCSVLGNSTFTTVKFDSFATPPPPPKPPVPPPPQNPSPPPPSPYAYSPPPSYPSPPPPSPYVYSPPPSVSPYFSPSGGGGSNPSAYTSPAPVTYASPSPYVPTYSSPSKSNASAYAYAPPPMGSTATTGAVSLQTPSPPVPPETAPAPVPSGPKQCPAEPQCRMFVPRSACCMDEGITVTDYSVKVWVVCNVDVQPLEGSCFTLGDLVPGGNASLVDPATGAPPAVTAANSLNTRATEYEFAIPLGYFVNGTVPGEANIVVDVQAQREADNATCPLSLLSPCLWNGELVTEAPPVDFVPLRALYTPTAAELAASEAGTLASSAASSAAASASNSAAAAAVPSPPTKASPGPPAKASPSPAKVSPSPSVSVSASGGSNSSSNPFGLRRLRQVNKSPTATAAAKSPPAIDTKTVLGSTSSNTSAAASSAASLSSANSTIASSAASLSTANSTAAGSSAAASVGGNVPSAESQLNSTAVAADLTQQDVYISWMPLNTSLPCLMTSSFELPKNFLQGLTVESVDAYGFEEACPPGELPVVALPPAPTPAPAPAPKAVAAPAAKAGSPTLAKHAPPPPAKHASPPPPKKAG